MTTELGVGLSHAAASAVARVLPQDARERKRKRSSAGGGRWGGVPASLVVIANPNQNIEYLTQYPDATGRNFDEIVRVVDTLQLHYANPTVACGVNWMVGEDVFITNDVPKDKAKALFPRGFVEIRPWFRLAPPPEAGQAAAFVEAMRPTTPS